MNKNYLLLCASLLFLASCVTQPKPLYSWGDYQKATYEYAKNGTDKDVESLMMVYDKLMQKQTGTRQMVPPGLCADYGFLLVQQGKKAEGLELLKKEVALYPESQVFVQRIVKMLE